MGMDIQKKTGAYLLIIYDCICDAWCISFLPVL